MSYKLNIVKSAFKQLSKLPTDYQEKIKIKIDALADTPRPHGCEKLSGRKNDYRIRIGIYRVVYSIFDKELLIEIIDIDHRKQIYRNL